MLLRRGASNRQIAERLGTSSSALKSSFRELRFKLDLSDQPSLRQFAHSFAPLLPVAPCKFGIDLVPLRVTD
jgi:DNA-binding NarL/FixJ family response regulator